MHLHRLLAVGYPPVDKFIQCYPVRSNVQNDFFNLAIRRRAFPAVFFQYIERRSDGCPLIAILERMVLRDSVADMSGDFWDCMDLIILSQPHRPRQSRFQAPFVSNEHVFLTVHAQYLFVQHQHVISGVYANLNGFPLIGSQSASRSICSLDVPQNTRDVPSAKPKCPYNLAGVPIEETLIAIDIHCRRKSKCEESSVFRAAKRSSTNPPPSACFPFVSTTTSALYFWHKFHHHV